MIKTQYRSWTTVLAMFLVAGLATATVDSRLLARGASARPAPEGFKLKGDAKNGEKIYKQYCQKCHGKKGNGQGTMAADLDPKPRNFTDKQYMEGRSDWELFLGVKEGGAPVGLSDQMTAWQDTLTEQETHDVVTFIRKFAETSSK